MSNFHLADSGNLNKEDKFAKLRFLFTHMNKKFIEKGVLTKMYSVDDIPVNNIYTGNHKDSGTSCGGSPLKKVNIDCRYDGLGHFVIPQEKQTRCFYCHEKANTRGNIK
ncbi:hypothetical protein ILUMI_26393 [Ignelater luminosus]|uniref:Uncharacterized protein n=1 Tax=Ignelater luminosus TaxID=2038154 RepID=A0A8K0C6P7_IGNLU|nr:hypothetical protein ILUMI_26393 [Ignelater luminosus]